MLEAMGQFGQFLLRAASLGDDMCTKFRRIEGNGRAPVVCFLPWCMPYRLAHGMGLVPRDFLVCYEMPGAIVSSEPDLCIDAMRRLADDAEATVHRAKIDPRRLVIIGMSMGTAVATYFANRLGARLWSIASADRGDLMLWESPAARVIRDRAAKKGYALSDFTRASEGYHPIENLGNLAPGSRFVVGLRDEAVPAPRREGLVAAVRRELPAAEISFHDAGHIQTLVASVRGDVRPFMTERRLSA
jgi:pimeloyl-ACP methyl ester carboxylesterase